MIKDKLTIEVDASNFTDARLEAFLKALNDFDVPYEVTAKSTIFCKPQTEFWNWTVQALIRSYGDD